MILLWAMGTVALGLSAARKVSSPASSGSSSLCFLSGTNTMLTDATAILEAIASKPLTGDLVLDLAHLVPVVESSMDGTSGALYAIFLNALTHALGTLAPATATPKLWADALRRASDALGRYTPARPGDRTLVDALHPFVEVLGRTGDVARAAEAARLGAESTRGMKASLGRTVYVGGSGFEEVPDPGAWGLACFFEGLAGLKAKAGEGETGKSETVKGDKKSENVMIDKDTSKKVVSEGEKSADEDWEAV